MDNHAAPPPYSETDIFSVTDSAPNDSLTPTSSQYDVTRSHEARTEHDIASVADSSVSIPPYSISGWQEPVAHPDLRGHLVPSTLASFFTSRSAPSQHIDTTPVHDLVLKEQVLQGDIRFPEPKELWMQRDVTRQDWAVLFNLLLGDHTQSVDNVATDHKIQTESTDGQLRQLTLGKTNASWPSSEISPDGGDDGHTNRSEQTFVDEQNANAQRIIATWNESFFASRGLHVILESPLRYSTEAQPRPESSTTENRARDAGPSRGFSIGGWLRADSTGFHIGKSILSADSNGFRMFGNGLVADSRGFRLGNSLVADSNGFRVGGVIADSRGVSTTTARSSDFSQTGHMGPEKGAAKDAATQIRTSQSHTQLSSASGNVNESTRHASHSSTSSPSSSSSSDESDASEISIESLPDYDHLTSNQLPLARSKVKEWLAHPERPVTAAQVHQLNQELRSTDDKIETVPASEGPLLRDEMKSLLHSCKKMMLTQKLSRRAERRERRAAKRAAKRQRRAARRSLRADRREARREAKGKRRAELQRQ